MGSPVPVPLAVGAQWGDTGSWGPQGSALPASHMWDQLLDMPVTAWSSCQGEWQLLFQLPPGLWGPPPPSRRGDTPSWEIIPKGQHRARQEGCSAPGMMRASSKALRDSELMAMAKDFHLLWPWWGDLGRFGGDLGRLGGRAGAQLGSTGRGFVPLLAVG